MIFFISNLLTCTNDGSIRLWPPSARRVKHEPGAAPPAIPEPIIRAGANVACFRQSSLVDSHFAATGGRDNDLTLWDLDAAAALFRAKNVHHFK